MMNKNEILADLLLLGDTSADALEQPGKKLFNKGKDVYHTLKQYKHDMDDFNKYAADNNYLTPNVDRYYHTAAMYDAVRGDPTKAAIAFIMGLGKEAKDIIKYSFTKNPVYAAKESIKDIQNNINGIYQSFLSDKPAEENPQIKQLQTPTMIDIMPMYKALKNENRQ